MLPAANSQPTFSCSQNGSTVSASTRALPAEGTDPAVSELAVPADAADRLRTERLNEVVVHGTTSRISRARRLLRWGRTDRKAHAPPRSTETTHPASATRAWTRTAPSTSTKNPQRTTRPPQRRRGTHALCCAALFLGRQDHQGARY
ncbi:DUF5954 family protein [Streptomyces sp. B-S-A12]|uniref:DUF5954 family protein n=2 Tax=Streptomyces luteolus TaxID=3043615 RepID=A0ABT6T9P0_9ACTN|nr:DUF5954 family protein [Streptomyces sp. B-S-A12]MDI3424088.1 DUF5954 family protein [Streptomyces sp. B-S-A12]